MREYFGFDRSSGVHFRGTMSVNLGFAPGFEYKVLSEENGVVTEIGWDGVTSRWSRNGHSTRQFIRFPVETREDFREIRKRFDPATRERLPEDWKTRPLALQTAGTPICLQVGGYYGFARSLMGLENLSVAFYEQPDLVEEIFECRTECVSVLIEKVLTEVRPDFAEFWEDMAFKTGSLVSPVLYRKMALKHYQRITEILRRHGVDIILLDSDGNIDELIPVWLDGGINAVWPLEIAAGMEPLEVRARFPRLALLGGIDKRLLPVGREAIRREIGRKVPRLLRDGGFFPSHDHHVPADVSFENFCIYLEELRAVAA
jgi:uroporphyrinogen decarboxylase